MEQKSERVQFSLTQIFSGLSEAQHVRLAAKGVDMESGNKKLSEVLFKDANDYLQDLRGKVRGAALLRRVYKESSVAWGLFCVGV